MDKLGDFVVRLGAGGGLALGALAGLQGHPYAAICPAHDPCVGEQFLSTMWSLVVPAGAGAVVGLAARLPVVLLLRRSRARTTKPSGPLGRWISARYAGRCRRCSKTVQPGDRVIWDDTDKAVICAACVS